MSVTIGTNVASLLAAHHLRVNRSGLDNAMQQLASGSRINSASDDAAGAGLAASLEAQARGVDQAAKNVGLGISQAQVADSALVEIQNMAIRIRELAVQKASTGTYTTTDISNIDLEIAWLNTEISNIYVNTSFNGTAVSGAGGTFAVTGDGDTIALTFPTFITTAGTTVSSVDTALNSIATARGTLGAYINRLDYSLNNLSNTAANTYGALSAVRDTDYSSASAAVAKGQILAQAGAAVLAQANASQQYVLTLLQ